MNEDWTPISVVWMKFIISFLVNKVSVIICLYNVSAFLRAKQLGCVLSQTHTDLEIILVDDGSTDSTWDICKELATKDNRIRILSKENGGLGSARNAGLDMATGDYIWFYDVDDEAENTLVEKCVQWMNRYQVDLVVFGFSATTPSRQLTEDVCFRERFITDNSTLKSIFVDELLVVPNGNGFAWNKFYRKSFLDQYGFRFGSQRIQQDEGFNLQIYPLLDRVYISPDTLYHYYIYNQGNTRSRYIDNRFDIYLSIFNGFKSFAQLWNLKSDKLDDYIYRRFFSGIETSILFNTFHPDASLTGAERKRIVGNILSNESTRNCLNYISNSSKLSVEQRLYMKAYKRKSYSAICVLRFISLNLRRVKRIFDRK